MDTMFKTQLLVYKENIDSASKVKQKFASLMHRPPLPPGNIPGTHFC
jgi:hypothetical protein